MPVQFNYDFAKDKEDYLISIVRDMFGGCFVCGAKCATIKSCSQCKIVM